MDVSHWICPVCGYVIEAEMVVDNAFMPTVLAHKAAHVPQSPKARVALRTWIDESFENGKR